MLVAKGRLELDRDVRVWIKQALGLPNVNLLPLTVDIAVTAAELRTDCMAIPSTD